MIKNKKIFLAVLSIMILLIIIINFKLINLKSVFGNSAAGKKTEFFAGEKMKYAVKFGKLRLGTSQLRSAGVTEIDGKRLNTIIFQTTAARFSDTETIYSDPETHLPIKIIREISNWFLSEKITEDYDQDNFKLTITKQRGSKTSSLLIEKDAPIHNPILLFYYAEDVFEFEQGRTLNVNLPGNKFQIRLASIEEIEVPAGVFKAYRFESSPKHIEIWISADRRRIPVRINGLGNFGYSLLLIE